MKMYADILAVGIPASLEQLIMAILAIIVNFLLTVVVRVLAKELGIELVRFDMSE